MCERLSDKECVPVRRNVKGGLLSRYKDNLRMIGKTNVPNYHKCLTEANLKEWAGSVKAVKACSSWRLFKVMAYSWVICILERDTKTARDSPPIKW